MRFATRTSPGKGTGSERAPREQESAEIIDLASRAAFPAVADRKARGDGLGLAAGVAVVFGIGALTFWAMEAARAPEPATIGNPDLAPPPPLCKCVRCSCREVSRRAPTTSRHYLPATLSP